MKLFPLVLLLAVGATPAVDAPDPGRPAPTFEPAIPPPTDPAEASKLGIPFGGAAKDCAASFPLVNKNVGLTRRLREALIADGWGPALKKRTLAVALVDLTPKNRIHYAGINDDEMIYAASLPKIAALLAVAQGVREKRFPWSKPVARDAYDMINRSSNPAASRMVALATVPYIEEVLTRPGYCFYGTGRGGLWLGRGYGGGGPTERDPVANSVHGATARQVARFYTMLDKGLLVGPVGSKRMKASMGSPKLHHKFVRTLDDLEAKVVARKSGSWRSFHSDSALVEHGDARYVVVALSHLKDGGKAMEAVAGIADRLILEGAHRQGTPALPPTEPAPVSGQ